MIRKYNHGINFKIISIMKLLYAVVIVLSFSNTAYASEADVLMLKGNEAYQNNKYSEAIKYYEELINLGYEGVPLFYNLGNAYYRTGKLGFSILYYEKALKLAPSDDDIQHNLKIANLKTIDKIETLPKFFMFEWWEYVLAMFSLTGWTVISYIFFLSIVFTTGLYFLAKRLMLKRYSFISSAVLLFFFFTSVVVLTVRINRELNIKNGVVIEPVVSVKLSPDEKSSDAFLVHEGIKVKLEDKVDEWVKIKLFDGKVGWLPSEAIKLI